MFPGRLGRHARVPRAVPSWQMRRRLLLVLALLVSLIVAPSALAHAVLRSATPEAGERLRVAPVTVRLTFSEPIDLLSTDSVDVVDEQGRLATGGQAVQPPRDRASISIPLQPALGDGTYTVRWRVISADAHLIVGAYTFVVGNGPIRPAVLTSATGAGGGPTETSIWAISARFLELVCLGGLIGMLAFRWLVWRPAIRDENGPPEHRALVLWARDAYWTGFGLLAVVAMLAEGYLLLTKTATLTDQSVAGALTSPGDMARILADTRFGTLAQLRAALLFCVFAVAIWQFLAEVGTDDGAGGSPLSGRATPAIIMGGLTVGALAAISAQGHAITGRAPSLQVAIDVTHLVTVAIWITGIALVGGILWRAPRVAGDAGRIGAAKTLSRFSKVALLAVGIAVVTGVLRAVGELSTPSDLWTTGYGRSILIKLALLAPIAFLGLRNRRISAAMSRLERPSLAALAVGRRSATVELVVSLAIVVVASLLVAQVPPPTG